MPENKPPKTTPDPVSGAELPRADLARRLIAKYSLDHSKDGLSWQWCQSHQVVRRAQPTRRIMDLFPRVCLLIQDIELYAAIVSY